MQIIMKKVGEIKPYEKNPRKNELSVEDVAASIKEFGFKVPIVIDKDGVIVTGHTRYKASKQLGMSEVPCIVADDLTEEQIKAFRLADNKVGESSTWDFSLLNSELEDIFDIDMSDFGFEDEDDPDDDDDPEKSRGDAAPDEKGYSITYEIAFNTEQEQQEWYKHLMYLKKKYPELDTISERVLQFIRENE